MKENIKIEKQDDKIKIFVDNIFIGSLFFQKNKHQLYWSIEDKEGNIENHLTNMINATKEIFKKTFPSTYLNYSWYYNNEFEENK